MAKDPVCGMTVDEKAPLRSTHEGQTYLFCSPGCQAKFDQEPARYAVPGGARQAQGGQP